MSTCPPSLPFFQASMQRYSHSIRPSLPRSVYPHVRSIRPSVYPSSVCLPIRPFIRPSNDEKRFVHNRAFLLIFVSTAG